MISTTVIGSYPLPGWLEHAAAHLDAFGPDDVAELQEDAVIAAVHDQVAAGLDVITDGEQTRLDFNLSFYGYLEGIELEGAPARRFGPPAHDQRGRHRVTGELARAARPRRGRRVRAAAARRAGRAAAEGERARAVHAHRAGSSRAPTTPTAGRSPRRCCRSSATSSSRSSTRAARRSASTSRR